VRSEDPPLRTLSLLPLAALLAPALLLAGAARAELMEASFYVAGDGLVTRDTESGLEWVDPTVTAGLSYEQVSNNALGLIAGGWRYATTGEVCELLGHMGFAPAPCPGVSPVVPGDATLVHLGFLGVLSMLPIGDGVTGVFEDDGPGDPAQGLASISHFFGTSQVSVTEDTQAPGVGDPEVGHFLVRPAFLPVPALPPGGAPLLAALWLGAGYPLLRRRASSASRSRPTPAKTA